MLVCETGLEQTICFDELHFQEARRDASSEQFADFNGQFAEAGVRVIMLVRGAIIEIPVRMKRGQFR